MNSNIPALFCKKEIWIITGLLLVILAVFLLLPKGQQGQNATVLQEGKAVATLPLNQDTEKTFESHGHTVTVAVQKGAVWVKASTCPDKLCVNTAPLSATGGAIVCLPAHLSVEVTGTASADGVTY